MSNVSGNTFWFKNESEKMVEEFVSTEQYSDSKRWTAYMYDIPPGDLQLAAVFQSGTKHHNRFEFAAKPAGEPGEFVFTQEFVEQVKKTTHVVVTYTQVGTLKVSKRLDDALDARLEELQKGLELTGV